MMNFLRAYRYELIAAAVGASVMMVEIVGARYIAPYFGTSIFVWTAMIGVILGAMSAGYWYGGRLADRSADDKGLAMLITFSAALLLSGLLAQQSVLELLAGARFDLRFSALAAAVILFAPASLFMGAVSPYLVKLRLSTMKTAGSSVGKMYAAGTLGSILGTFAAGYFLIGLFGSALLGYLIVIALLAISFTASRRGYLRLRLTLAGLTMVFMALFSTGPSGYKVIYDTDSTYARYQVIEEPVGNNRTIRVLKMDNSGSQSGVYTDAPSEMPFAYTQRFLEAAAATKPKSVLMIGGGAFTVPRILAEEYPDIEIDVVEIDPKLTDIAREYFYYDDNPRISIINQDGRTLINESSRRYDMIYIDAFNSLTPPFQLTTKEAAQKLDGLLNENGVVVVNLIDAIDTTKGKFFAAEYKTYGQVFPALATSQVTPKLDFEKSQNIIMVAGRNQSEVEKVISGLNGFSLPEPLVDDALVLTDDYAPVEQLLEE